MRQIPVGVAGGGGRGIQHVAGWLRQVVMHLWMWHQPLLMYSLSDLNKELTSLCINTEVQ